MATHSTTSPDLKQVPQDATVRHSMRYVATELARHMLRDNPPTQAALETQARLLLHRLSLAEKFLGYAMVAVNNAFWLEAFLAVPFDRRLLLLPHCLSNKSACSGTYSAVGLHCAHCGKCEIHDLQTQAQRLGYQVIIAEGTGSALTKILDGQVDAMIGVACMDSLEKSFSRIVELGIPPIAIPLLTDGCRDTQAEFDEIRSLLTSHTPGPASHTRSYVPLLRQTVRIFQEPTFSQFLAPSLGPDQPPRDGLNATSDIAVRWLHEGGKRLRPFVTLASYAVARGGRAALEQGSEYHHPIPPAVQRLAIAIEALHKASLIHDDIEDGDEFRYGRETLHRQYGLGPAVNAGDYLVGLGYRLIAGETSTLGAGAVSDILAQLSQAHLDLCRGQGAELQWQKQSRQNHRPADVLAVYGLKTAPAFEAAIYAGLRAADVLIPREALRRLATYLGESFQILNDLDDWTADDHNKLTVGLDVLSNRPTLLRALAGEADDGQALSEIDQADPARRIELVRGLYLQTEAFARAESLLENLRQRAFIAADEFPSPDLQELMRFLIRTILPVRTRLHPPAL